MRGSLLFACLVSLTPGCSANSAADDAAGVGGSSSAGAGGAGGDVSRPRALEFDEIGQLAAREQVVLRVHVRPPNVYRVRFSLPAGTGDPLDAVLDRSESDTDPSGFAEVVLTAPSASAEFDVRASASGVSSELRVSVKDTGVTSVHVQPKYSGPYRNIETWTATVHRDTSCAELPGIPPEDGPFWAIAPKDAAPTIDNVPALVPLAVTLRSGHYVGGCASVEMLSPGGSHVVQVTVLNRPIDLAASRLSLSLGLAEIAPAWDDFLVGAERAALQALPGTSSGDVDTLLDAMRGAAGVGQQALETARKAESWDALLSAQWGAAADTKLTATLGGWLSAGRARLTAGDHVIQGTIDAPGASDAELDLTSIAGLPAERAGLASPARVTWSATSDDQVLLSSDLYVVSSRLATALAEAAVLELDGEAEDAPTALATALDCSGLAAALTAAGADNAHAYAGCDAGCLSQLCEKAAQTLWQRARDASALAPARLVLSAAGQAYVGDAAEVAGISGSWIGALRQGETEAKTGGSLKATTPKD